MPPTTNSDRSPPPATPETVIVTGDGRPVSPAPRSYSTSINPPSPTVISDVEKSPTYIEPASTRRVDRSFVVALTPETRISARASPASPSPEPTDTLEPVRTSPPLPTVSRPVEPLEVPPMESPWPMSSVERPPSELFPPTTTEPSPLGSSPMKASPSTRTAPPSVTIGFDLLSQLD